MEKNPKLAGYVAITIAMLFWGMSFVWTKQLLNAGFPVFTIVFLRLVIASIIFVTLFKLQHKLEKIQKGDWKWFFLLAFFEPFLYFIGEDFGMMFVEASVASVMIALIPIVVSITMHFAEGEALRAEFFIGTIVSVIGVFIMTFGFGGSLQVNFKGVAILMVAVLAAAGYSVMLSRMLKTYSPITVTTMQNLLAIPFYLPFVFIFDLRHWGGLVWSWSNVSSLLCLAVLCSSGAYMCYSFAAKKITVTKVSVFANAIPIVTLFCATLIGQETITLQKCAGVLLVVVGVVLSQMNFRK